jgi:hypothetical protein
MLKLVPWVSWFGCDEIYGWIERIEKKCCDGEKEEQRVYGKVKQRIWKWKREREREWVSEKEETMESESDGLIERTWKDSEDSSWLELNSSYYSDSDQ